MLPKMLTFHKIIAFLLTLQSGLWVHPPRSFLASELFIPALLADFATGRQWPTGGHPGPITINLGHSLSRLFIELDPDELQLLAHD